MIYGLIFVIQGLNVGEMYMRTRWDSCWCSTYDARGCLEMYMSLLVVVCYQLTWMELKCISDFRNNHI